MKRIKIFYFLVACGLGLLITYYLIFILME
jgi:hypothetical protein